MKLSTVQLASVAAVFVSLTTSAMGQGWSDDFESYAAGSALELQGGWAGWDGASTGFTIVSTAQANGGTQSIQPNPGADTVQQFTPVTSGVWTLQGWVYVPTGFSSSLDFMVMNTYQDFGPYEWGSWVTFDGVTGEVICNCGGFSSATVPIPYDRWVEVRKVIDLDNDLADIYFDGTLFASYAWSGGYSGSQGHQVPGIQALDIYSVGTGTGLFIDDLSLTEGTGDIGASYCDPAVSNSSGLPGSMSASGVRSAASNDVTLTASDLPTNSFGFFITGQTQGFVANPNGSAGNLCLSGAIGRYVGSGQIQNAGGAGEFSLALDLTMTPQPTGFVSVAAGQTWNFQSWYRDVVSGTAGSNFTNGLSIAFN